jgi:hypothetical protein
MQRTGVKLLPRFQKLDRTRQRLLIEAVATLTFISVALHLLPFKRAIRLGAVRISPRHPGSKVEDVIWAVEAAARRLPWTIVCIQSGISAQRMLRRRGKEAILHYGVGNGRRSENLEAHVWVAVDGQPVIGGEEARAFAPVAAFPSD